jgi:hypothetical protein
MERQNQAQADTFLQGLQAASIEALQASSISITDRSSAFVHTGLTLTLKPGFAFSLSYGQLLCCKDSAFCQSVLFSYPFLAAIAPLTCRQSETNSTMRVSFTPLRAQD